ncbi:hypothetical protein ACEPAF_4898 [Sanghuangporus sanghuang]
MHSAPSPFSIRTPAPRRVRPSPTRFSLDGRPSAIPPPSVGTETSISRCSPPRDVPPCLMSPIRLPERRARPPCPSSPTPQCTSGRRRRSAYATRSSGRSRHCRLSDCSIVCSGPATFDKIPWISMLDAEPEDDRIIPLNLSDLPIRPCAKDSSTISGPGPIRSRKSSLRSAPFPTDLTQLATPELVPTTAFDSPLTELPFSLDSPADDDVLKTPPMRPSVLPVDAGFHRLMPLAFADVHAEENWWQREPSST